MTQKSRSGDCGGCGAGPTDECYCGNRALVAEVERLESVNRELVAVLKESRHSHYYCDDGWYSCPKAEDGCDNEDIPKDTCNCGAEEFNAKVDAALALAQEKP